MRFNTAILGLVALNAATAFTIQRATVKRSFLKMADDSEDTLFVKSARKELAFDEKTGRFFETGYDEGACIPDDEFCVTDSDSGELIRLTVEEKERIFLDALQAYYTTGRQMLSDEQFDLLKEDLTWNGSPMVIMKRKEAQYLNAVQCYLKGEPCMSDMEFDRLKAELLEEGSKFAVQTEPKCYIDTGICKVTLQEDNFRSNLLYLPALAIVTIVWLGVGFEILNPLISLNPLVLALIGAPIVYVLTKAITENFIFEDKLLVYGPCPSCQFENRVYFGNILGVEGFTTEAQAKCPNCKTVFTVQRNTLRASTLPKE